MTKTALQTKQLASLPAQNILINGCLTFWQRNTTFTNVANGAYLADRFQNASNLATGLASVTRSSVVPTVAQSGFQSQYSLLYTVTTAQASIGASEIVRCNQVIEGQNYQALHANPGRLQFWLRSSSTGTYSVSFQNNARDRIYTTSYTINSANTWELKTFDLTFDNTGVWLFDNGVGLSVEWVLAAGTNYSGSTVPNAWTSGSFGTHTAVSGQTNLFATNGNTWQIAQVMLAPGSFKGASFPFRRAGGTIDGELVACQRYYEKSYDVDVSPGANTGAASALGYYQFQAAATNYILPGTALKVSKRLPSPVVVLYGSNGAINSITLSGTGDIAGTVAVSTNSMFSARATAARAANDLVFFHYTCSAEF